MSTHVADVSPFTLSGITTPKPATAAPTLHGIATASPPTLAQSLRDALVDLLAPLSFAASPDGFRAMMEAFGHTSAVSGNDALRTAIAQAASLVDELSHIDPSTLVSIDGVQKVVSVAQDAVSAVRAVEQALTDPALATLAKGLGQQIVGRLVSLYLRQSHERVHRVLSLLTLIDPAELTLRSPLVVSGAAFARTPTVDDAFHLERLSTLLAQPGTALKTAYLPNSLAKIADVYTAADRLFPIVSMLARALGVQAYRDLFPLDPPSVAFTGDMLPGDHVLADQAPTPATVSAVDPNVRRARFMPRLSIALVGSNGAAPPLGIGIVLSSAQHAGAVAGAIVTLDSALAWSQMNGPWTLDFKAVGQVPAFVIGPTGVALAPTSTPVTAASGQLTIARAPDGATAVIIGNPGGTRLEIGKLQFGVAFDLSPSQSSVGVTARAEHATIAIVPGDADSFLASVLPSGGLSATFDLGVTLSSDKGLVITGKGGLSTTIPVGLSVGGTGLQSLNLALGADPANGGSVRAEVSADLSASIGPVKASIARFGLAGSLRFPATGGNLGVADLSLGLQPPATVGLSIDVAGVVTGSGFVTWDPAQGLYAGALQLTLHDRLSLTAIGLISTRLPDGQPGYSLLVFITADGFQPVPLGLGFSLTAIGGMVGIHRTFDEAVLREGIKTDALATLLFPRDPGANAPAIVRSLSSAFPAKTGSYLLGLLARICWGPAQLLQFELGLILELGGRTRLLALGRVSALVPRPDNDLVRIKGDAIGVLDFDAGTLAVDAVLVDSRVAGKFAITGSGALRAGWGSGPGTAFVYSVGGFNPRFAPPAGVPALDRVTIALCAGANPRLTCEAYFAITSNTLQFGARAQLSASYGGFTLLGDVGFDVLMTSLSHFIADFHASIQLKRGSRNLFKVSVSGTLEGVRPMRLSGKATFEILWCDVTVSFHATLVDGTAPVAATIGVLAPLVAALSAASNWRTDAGSTPHGVVLTPLPPPSSTTPMVVDPLGQLSVTQSVVPLGTARDIDTLDGARVVGDRRFSLTAQIGRSTATQTSPVLAPFAPGQFFALTDDAKLASQSYEDMQSGVTIGTADVLIDQRPAALVSAPLAYLAVTLDGPELAPVQTPTPVFHLMTAGKLDDQRATGSAARAPVRRAGRSRFQTDSAAAVTVETTQWTIVPIAAGATAAPTPKAALSAGSTWIEQRAALDALNRGGAQWQLVPVHELAP